MFLEKSAKSLLRSASLINNDVGEKPDAKPSTSIFKSESASENHWNKNNPNPSDDPRFPPFLKEH